MSGTGTPNPEYPGFTGFRYESDVVVGTWETAALNHSNLQYYKDTPGGDYDVLNRFMASTLYAGGAGFGTNNHVVRWDGTTNLQDSLWIIDDDGTFRFTDANTANVYFARAFVGPIFTSAHGLFFGDEVFTNAPAGNFIGDKAVLMGWRVGNNWTGTVGFFRAAAIGAEIGRNMNDGAASSVLLGHSVANRDGGGPPNTHVPSTSVIAGAESCRNCTNTLGDNIIALGYRQLLAVNNGSGVLESLIHIGGQSATAAPNEIQVGTGMTITSCRIAGISGNTTTITRPVAVTSTHQIQQCLRGEYTGLVGGTSAATFGVTSLGATPDLFSPVGVPNTRIGLDQVGVYMAHFNFALSAISADAVITITLEYTPNFTGAAPWVVLGISMNHFNAVDHASGSFAFSTRILVASGDADPHFRLILTDSLGGTTWTEEGGNLFVHYDGPYWA